MTGVNNVKATDLRRRYGSDGAQPSGQHRTPWLYRLYFQPLPLEDGRSDCRKSRQETGSLLYGERVC